ncbi:MULTISPECIES: hypothetical protein [Haloarcula]|uniref:hypothetical protein n=1 Tax=Haloarcula TaxID=2237 RepID=UPI0023ECCB03|nr:hypothetical protein [Halomicroarcula sp. XH51]
MSAGFVCAGRRSHVLDRGVTVVSCRDSLDGRDADAVDLLEGVTAVPTAIWGS